MEISIKYAPLQKRRRKSTQLIAQALETLRANPADPSGTPGWFSLDKKYATTVRDVAKELGIDVRVEVFENLARVRLKAEKPVEDPNQSKLPLEV